MSGKKTRAVKLTPNEFEFLELFWNHGKLTLAEAHKLLIAKGKEIAYPTVQTRLNRLVEKKIIKRSGQYPAVYEAVIRPQEISKQYFELLETVCGGNLGPLMVHLSERHDFKPPELAILKEIIRKHEGNES